MPKFLSLLLILSLLVLTACGGAAAGETPIGTLHDSSDNEVQFFDFSVELLDEKTCETFSLSYEDADYGFSYKKNYLNVEMASVEVVYKLLDGKTISRTYNLLDSDMYGMLPYQEVSQVIDAGFQDRAFLSFLSFDFSNKTDSVSLYESVYREIDKSFKMGNHGDGSVYNWGFKDNTVYYVYNLSDPTSCSQVFPIEIDVDVVDLEYTAENVVVYNDGSNKFEFELKLDELSSMKSSESSWVNTDPASIHEFDGTFSFEYGTANSNSFIRFLQQLPATVYYQTDGSSSTFGKIVFND